MPLPDLADERVSLRSAGEAIDVGAVRIMQAFEAEVVTQKRFARNEFEATRFAAAARATLDPANLRRQFALVP